MQAGQSLVAALAAALSLISGSAHANPITSITIPLPANPDASLQVAVADVSGNFRGRVSAPAGDYIVSTACVEAASCTPMRITSLIVDGRRIMASADGIHRLSVRSGRNGLLVSGSVAALR